MSAPSYTTNDPRGWCGDLKRGAAIGRPSDHCQGFEGRIFLRRIRLNSGGYDPNGTYFGIGVPLYWVASEGGEVDYMLRADSRGSAREMVLVRYPLAKVRR